MRDKNFYLGLIGIPGILLIISIFFIFNYLWIGADAPYYLATARDLSEGEILYKDIANGYTPLVMVVFSYVFLLFKDQPFLVSMLVHFGFILLGGIVLFLILRKLNLSVKVSIALATIFVLAILSSDGNYIVLEVYSVFFVLLAVLLLVKDRAYLLTGILLGCSFLCKQYGVLNFIPFFFYIWFKKEMVAKIMKCTWVAAGGALVLALFVGYYSVVRDLGLVDLLKQISGAGYSEASVARDRSLISILIGAKVFILFGSIGLLYLLQEKGMTFDLLFCFVGVVACLLPVYLRGYQHYYINTFPYLFTGIGVIIASLENNALQKKYLLVVLATGIISSLFLIARIVRYSDQSMKQLQTADLLATYIPKGSMVYIDGPMRYLYILNGYKNPFLETIGYTYTFNKVDSLINNIGGYAVLSYKKIELENIKILELETPSGKAILYSEKDP